MYINIYIYIIYIYIYIYIYITCIHIISYKSCDKKMKTLKNVKKNVNSV